MAGGFIQGGGYGPLSSIHGLASDNALSFEVVTATGEAISANSESNIDLFWALKGGGPGTWGVVTSVTLKTHPTVMCIGMSLNVTATGSTFWKAFGIFQSFIPGLSEAGMYVWYSLTADTLTIQPLMGPNMTLGEFNKVSRA